MNQFLLVHWINCVKSKWHTLSKRAEEKLASVLTQNELTSDLNHCLQLAKNSSTLEIITNYL